MARSWSVHGAFALCSVLGREQGKTPCWCLFESRSVTARVGCFDNCDFWFGLYGSLLGAKESFVYQDSFPDISPGLAQFITGVFSALLSNKQKIQLSCFITKQPENKQRTPVIVML